MKYCKGDSVEYKIPAKYGQNSIEYRHESGKITEVFPKCKGYYILEDGYDTPVFIPEHNILSRIPSR